MRLRILSDTPGDRDLLDIERPADFDVLVCRLIRNAIGYSSNVVEL